MLKLGRIFRRSLQLPFILLVAGCGSSANYEPLPLPLPGEREEFLSPIVVKAGGAPRPSIVTIEEAMEEAISQSPDVLAASEIVVQSRADLTTSSLYPNPELSGGTTLQPLPGTHLSPSNPGGPPQYSVDLSVPLDPLLFGKRSASIESAKRAVDVSGADLADLKRLRAGDVAAAFYDLLEAKAILVLVREDQESLRRVEALTRQRVDLGGAPALELDRARLALAVSQQDLRSAETAELSARATLRALLGRRDQEDAFDVKGTLDAARVLAPPELEKLVASADEMRPDLVSLRRQVRRWESDVLSQRQQALPALALSGGYVYQVQDRIGGSNMNLWEASLSLTIPLFDRNQGNISKSESQSRQAALALEGKRAVLRAELSQALATFRSAHAALAADDAAQLDAAKSVRDRTEASYKTGGRTLLDLLDAERAYRDAQRMHIRTQSSYWHAFYRLGTAVGRPLSP